MWYSNPSLVEILEREMNNWRHMVDSSRKALGEKQQKDNVSGEGKNVLKELFISALLPERAGVGAGAMGSLLPEALRQTRCGLTSCLFVTPAV